MKRTPSYYCLSHEPPIPFCYHEILVLMLRFETAGESHGECLVATLTGLPAGIPISIESVNRELWRRQQGYGRGGRMKIDRKSTRLNSSHQIISYAVFC